VRNGCVRMHFLHPPLVVDLTHSSLHPLSPTSSAHTSHPPRTHLPSPAMIQTGLIGSSSPSSLPIWSGLEGGTTSPFYQGAMGGEEGKAIRFRTRLFVQASLKGVCDWIVAYFAWVLSLACMCCVFPWCFTSPPHCNCLVFCSFVT
jgi:hypothetical protein